MRIYPFLLLASSLACFSFADTSAESLSSMPPTAVAMLPKGIITPPVEPLVKNGWDIVIDADFLWWKPYVGDFNIAIVDNRPVQPNFSFVPGLKLGTGMGILHDGWDMYFQYTWLHEGPSKKTSTASLPSFSTQAFPFLQVEHPEDLSVMILSSVSSTRSFTFNILDMEMGRDFFISKRLTLRPFFGFKLCSLFEKTDIHYTGTEEVKSSAVSLRQNLNGVGILGGLDTVWHVVRSFGFYGNLALTGLWGDFHNTFSNTVSLEDLSTSYGIKNVVTEVIPVIEASVGATYMLWLCQERYLLRFKAGWEEQIWLSYNHNISNSLLTSGGNLTLQGFTFEAAFAF